MKLNKFKEGAIAYHQTLTETIEKSISVFGDRKISAKQFLKIIKQIDPTLII